MTEHTVNVTMVESRDEHRIDDGWKHDICFPKEGKTDIRPHGYNPDAVRDVVEALRLLLPVNVANNSYIDDDVMIPVDIPMSELRVALAALARLGGAS